MVSIITVRFCIPILYSAFTVQLQWHECEHEAIAELFNVACVYAFEQALTVDP